MARFRAAGRVGASAAALTFCLSVAGCDGTTPGAVHAGGPRNVILVSVDTTRADRLGCYGGTTVRTPHIDRFAAQAARFQRCITSTPETLPAHASMLTGQYPFVHGARANGVYRLAGEATSVAELLQVAGFTTHAEVAALVLNAKYGLNQGFATFTDLDEPPPPADTPPGQARLTVNYVERKAEDVTSRAAELLKQARDGGSPYFLFLHYFDPHQPYTAPEPFRSQYPEDGYAAEIAYFDEQFGRLMATVDELGLAASTLVILTRITARDCWSTASLRTASSYTTRPFACRC